MGGVHPHKEGRAGCMPIPRFVLVKHDVIAITPYE